MLPAAPGRAYFESTRDGYLFSIDTEQVGMAALELGAGRRRKEDVVDPSVGLMVLKRLGDPVRKGEPLFELHYTREDTLSNCKARLEAAVRIEQEPPEPMELLMDRMEI